MFKRAALILMALSTLSLNLHAQTVAERIRDLDVLGRIYEETETREALQFLAEISKADLSDHEVIYELVRAVTGAENVLRLAQVGNGEDEGIGTPEHRDRAQRFVTAISLTLGRCPQNQVAKTVVEWLRDFEALSDDQIVYLLKLAERLRLQSEDLELSASRILRGGYEKFLLLHQAAIRTLDPHDKEAASRESIENEAFRDSMEEVEFRAMRVLALQNLQQRQTHDDLVTALLIPRIGKLVNEGGQPLLDRIIEKCPALLRQVRDLKAAQAGGAK